MIERAGVEPDRLVEVDAEGYDEGAVKGRFLPDGTRWWDHDLPPTLDGRPLPPEPFRHDPPPQALGIPLLLGTTRHELAGGIQRPDTRRIRALEQAHTGGEYQSGVARRGAEQGPRLRGCDPRWRAAADVMALIFVTLIQRPQGRVR